MTCLSIQNRTYFRNHVHTVKMPSLLLQCVGETLVQLLPHVCEKYHDHQHAGIPQLYMEKKSMLFEVKYAQFHKANSVAIWSLLENSLKRCIYYICTFKNNQCPMFEFQPSPMSIRPNTTEGGVLVYVLVNGRSLTTSEVQLPNCFPRSTERSFET